MSKINPFAFARPKRLTKEAKYVDSRYPDTEIYFKFRAPDIVDYNAIIDASKKFLEEYDGLPFSVNGEPVFLSETLVQSVASVYILQEMEDKYTMEELIALSINLPVVFTAILADIADISNKNELGNLIRVRILSEPSQDSQNVTQS